MNCVINPKSRPSFVISALSFGVPFPLNASDESSSIRFLAQSVASTSFAASAAGRLTAISRSYGKPAILPRSLIVPVAAFSKRPLT
ncbi:MAG: hypothetical protein DMF62_07890, partial [Acidobacteria bacterium]